jgi:UDP-glucuronate 4-epimerase
MTTLVTGAAGFIGFHVAAALLARGEPVIGLDNVNAYYDPELKRARLARLQAQDGFSFHRLDVQDRESVFALIRQQPQITHVVHLAAQAGVRHSLIDPYTYVDTNIMGQVVMLEACRLLPRLAHLVYASSSSVYGGNQKLPFAVADRVDLPVSLYAASKRAQELVSECYADLHGLPQTGLRFFTVYGPWGRPDMAAYIFTKAIFEARPIRLFNKGDMKRDFTYIDDIVAGVLAAVDRPPAESGRQKLYNLGNNDPVELSRFVAVLEQACGQSAIKELSDMQPGDVVATYADIEAARRDLDFAPRTGIEEGLGRFVAWYRDYHGL